MSFFLFFSLGGGECAAVRRLMPAGESLCFMEHASRLKRRAAAHADSEMHYFSISAKLAKKSRISSMKRGKDYEK